MSQNPKEFSGLKPWSAAAESDEILSSISRSRLDFDGLIWRPCDRPANQTKINGKKNVKLLVTFLAWSLKLT